jgi:hypothetical protein
MTPLRGRPKVSGRQKIKHQAIIPKTAVENQLFTPMVDDIYLIKGDIVLPICPTTLVQPKPKLLISVGYSYAV